jgi:hypothetical protein
MQMELADPSRGWKYFTTESIVWQFLAKMYYNTNTVSGMVKEVS